MKKIILSLLLPVILIASTTIYVSPHGQTENDGSLQNPFHLLSTALESIQHTSEEDTIIIELMDGVYKMREPIITTSQQQLAAHLIIRNHNNTIPILDGGQRISNWKKGLNGIWTANVPEVKKAGWNFIQLYVNGELRKRARIPNKGFLRVAGFPDGGSEVNYHTDCQRFEFAEGDINPKWHNIDDIDVIVYHFWTDSHLPIQSIDAENNIVTFKHKAGKVFTDDFSSNGARYIVENVYEGLDQPGEWYLDRKKGKIYYIPLPDEDMQTAEIVAPVLPEFIRLEGDAMQRNYVKNITFEGLHFQYSNWQLPSGNSNDNQGSASVPAAITVSGAKGITIKKCSIQNLGTGAFEIGAGCSDIHILNNTIHHIAAGGFRVNGGDETSHPLLRTGHNLIADNVLHHFGETYPSACGVLLMHTHSNTVEHNLIHHGYYTGISIGWEWGYQRSISRDNIIAFNHIHHIGQGLLSDMGAIYTLGVSPGTVIRNNLIHDIDSNHYGGWGIYNDEGSTHILIENNVVYNTKFSGYNIHFAKEITVRNNIFALSRLNLLSRTRMESHQSVYFENNICYWTQGKLLDGTWNDQKYDFYFHPKSDNGTREMTSTFVMDYNIFFNPNLSVDSLRFGKENLSEWQKRNKDVHSLYADPLFENPSAFNFKLKKNSPAFNFGFQPIDLDSVGPRK